MNILSGDWWLIRQQKVPLSEKTVNHNKEERLKKPENYRPRTWSYDIALGEISEKAAKFCCRLHCMHLVGLREILAELQIVDDDLTLSAEQRKALRERFDVPEGKPWTERLKKDLDRWTLDFIYKLGVFRGEWDPAPPTIDWASSMTWLTMTQSDIPKGTRPMDYFLYSLCAMQLCSKTETLDDDPTATGKLVPVHVDQPLADWQVRVLRCAEMYLETCRPLLNQSNLQDLKLLVKEESVQLFVRAAKCSAEIHTKLLGWGIQL